MACRFVQSVFVGVAACAFALGGAARADAQVYTVVEMGTLPGMIDTFPTGINARGDVVGWSIDRAYQEQQPGSFIRGFLFTDGVMREIVGLPGMPNVYPLAINDLGHIVGWVGNGAHGRNQRARAFLFKDGHMTDLGTLGGRYSYALAINNADQIVGYATSTDTGDDSTDWPSAFLYTDGLMQNMDMLTGLPTRVAYAINDAGTVVIGADGLPDGFTYSGGVVAPQRTLGGANCEGAGTAINALGHITGSACWAPSYNHAFIDRGGVMTDIDGQGVMTDLGVLPGYRQSVGWAINNRDEVVGASSVSDRQDKFIFSHGAMHSLGDILSQQGWQLSWRENMGHYGHGINDAGQIIATARRPSPLYYPPGGEHALLLNPFSGLNTPPAQAAWGGAVDLEATAYDRGYRAPGKTIDFSLNGSPVGSVVTDANGVARLAQISVAGLEPGTYPGAIVASFAGDTDTAASTASADLYIVPLETTSTLSGPTTVTIQPGDTADSSLFVADSGGVAGTFQYSWEDGSQPGLTRLCVTFTPSDLVHYLPNESCVEVNINFATSSSQPIVESRLPVGLAVGASFSTSGLGGGVTVDSSRNLVYAGSSDDGTIAVIDGTTNQIIDTIQLQWGGLSGWVYLTAVDPAKNRLYVLDLHQPLFWTVDTATRAVISATPLEDYDVWQNSGSFELNPTTGLAYWGTFSEGIPVIAVVDPEHPAAVTSLVQTTPGCAWPISVAIDPVTNLIYDSCGDVIGGDPLTPSFSQVISNLGASGSVAVNPRTHTVYVIENPTAYATSIAAFDGNPASPTYAQLASRMQLAESVPFLSDVYSYAYVMAITVNPVSNLVYVKVGTAYGTGALAALDGSTLALASFTWGSDPAVPVPRTWSGGLVVNANTGRVYMSEFDRTVVFRDRVPATAPTAASANPVVIAGISVSVVFSSVSAGGTTTVAQVDASNLGLQLPGQFLIDGALAYEITTTATVSPPMQLCFNVSSVNDQSAFNALAVLHGENGAWVDRTTSHDFSTRTICASVTSLSPFVIARFIEPTYGIVRLYDSTKSFKAGSTASIRLQITSAGVNVSTASLTVHAIELRQTSTSASPAVVDSGRSNPDQNFRFDAGLGGSGGYIFNLKTTGLSTGAYELRFTVGSGQRQYSVPVQVR